MSAPTYGSLFSDLDRRAFPMTEGPAAAHPTRARQLVVDTCPIDHARVLVARWHSRLPATQKGPWKFAHRAHFDGFTYAVALWNNPSARTLPAHWLELRRLAVAPDAPHCTASRMLGQMAHLLAADGADVLISYQDLSVHKGTIYKAAGWEPVLTSRPRVRDRSANRVGTSRLYRSSLNGQDPDASAKTRWQKSVGGGASVGPHVPTFIVGGQGDIAAELHDETPQLPFPHGDDTDALERGHVIDLVQPEALSGGVQAIEGVHVAATHPTEATS